ncbi:MAG: GFA family protein [Pseudomonadota bacterium]
MNVKGSCLCGDVVFELTGPLRGKSSACHCTQCRKQTGHHWASANVASDGLQMTGKVTWYEASDTATRGFCAKCGSFLFWKAHDEDQISFSLGCVDGPTGVKLERHIFTADKGDYYSIADGLPQL